MLKGFLLCLSLRLFLFRFVNSFVGWLVFFVVLVAGLVEIFVCLLVESLQEETA